MSGWFDKKRRERGRRALERQLEFQERKAVGIAETSDELAHTIFLRSQAIRQRLNAIRPLTDAEKVLEVGSGAHGLIFGFAANLAIGVDPLAVDYKRLFPRWQQDSKTIAAIGEQLPFDDGAFDIVMSDNVIDHAEDPEKILHEIIRVLRPGGLLYFTVNIHHPVYDLASRLHGAWNAVGLRLELSAFADHTVHFTEQRIREIFSRLPLAEPSIRTTVIETKAAFKKLRPTHPEILLKRLFFKNALFEATAIRANGPA